jgi:hypothetical protein
MYMTKHAHVRCQQRGIQPLIRQWLLDYGAEAKTNDGCVKRYFDQAARRRIAADFGAAVVDRMGDLMNTYLVETGASIVTAGIRTRRFKRR